MKKSIALCLMTTVLTSCVYYRPPNYRAPETPGQTVSTTSYGSLETEGEAHKYMLSFEFHYDYRNGKRPSYPTGREFTLTKMYSKFADSEEFKQNPTQFIPGYRSVPDFKYEGTWDFDKAACLLTLENKTIGLSVQLHGKVDRLVETVSGSGVFKTYMAYKVKKSSLPELTGKVFLGDVSGLVCDQKTLTSVE